MISGSDTCEGSTSCKKCGNMKTPGGIKMSLCRESTSCIILQKLLFLTSQPWFLKLLSAFRSTLFSSSFNPPSLLGSNRLFLAEKSASVQKILVWVAADFGCRAAALGLKPSPSRAKEPSCLLACPVSKNTELKNRPKFSVRVANRRFL